MSSLEFADRERLPEINMVFGAAFLVFVFMAIFATRTHQKRQQAELQELAAARFANKIQVTDSRALI